MKEAELDQLSINTLRFLAVDAVENANSGHPGAPLDAAPMVYVLWTRYLKHNPADPGWIDRDRFVLSAGHASALLYSLLHLTGYEQMTLDQLKRFRQWHSLTPGHPESHLTQGVESSTGPLGQGIGNAVGMAIAEAHLAARYNRPGHEVFNHHTYVLAGDGDMMEGVQAEAASLAGHLQLGKLIVFYDSNGVTLSGTSSLAFTEDVGTRYRAYGWHVQRVEDGNDVPAISSAIRAARDTKDQPSIIIVRTVLGYGAPDKEGSFEAHGNPLGTEELKKTKQNLGWPQDPPFEIPAEALRHFRSALERGKTASDGWKQRFDAYAKAFPELADEITRRFGGRLPPRWDANLPQFAADQKGLATRKASESVLQELARTVPELVGGSGDLDPSTYTWLKEDGDFESPLRSQQGVQGIVGGGWGYGGRNVHFGVREHAMAAAVNGLVYHGGFIPFGATFLVFSDYMRPSIRLSAIARLRSVWVFTHDSIAVGEDGPTHEPVEQLLALRAIPGMVVLRPADANETRCAWQLAMDRHDGPTTLILTRQHVPTLDRRIYAPAEGLQRGAYVLNVSKEVTLPELILIATGSEVSLIVGAEAVLRERGVRVRLVSMPSWELFADESPEYRESVLPAPVTARLAVEAGRSIGWERWVGPAGDILSVDRFGASAPGSVVMKEYGFSVDTVVARSLALLARTRTAPATLRLPPGTRACLFDLDGVLTQTAKVHAAAWKAAFDQFLGARSRSTGEPFVPFDPIGDYDNYVDGKPRIDGVRSFFDSRSIRLPEGEEQDPPTAETLHGIGNRKNEIFLHLLREGRVLTYDGSIRLVHAVRSAGLKTAVVSSSKNCREVLDSAGIADLFDVRIDGVVAAREHLAGKPAPDTYLAAARALAVEPEHAAIFEDALSGVEAGRAGHFGYVVGVDRVGQASELRRHGADVVVDDLATLMNGS